MQDKAQVYHSSAAGQSVISTNKVLRNTYAFLAITIIFSAITATLSVKFQAPPMPWFIHLAVFFGLLWGIHKTKNSGACIPLVFAFTGFLGFALGPMLSMVLSVNPTYIVTSLGLTGLTFFGLSAYALVTRKDFSFLSGFLVVGFFVIMGSILLNIFLQIPALSLAISAVLVLFASAAILWETSNIIHGGETNYVLATVSLYVSIYNLFVSILHLVTAFGGDD